MLKATLTLIALTSIVTLSIPAFAETRSFQVSVRIPAHINMAQTPAPAESSTQQISLNSAQDKQEVAVRNNREVLLKTSVTL